MALSLQVLYPATDGTTFDMDYYLGTHIPMVGEHMGAFIENVLVTKGLGGGAPDAPAQYHAVATMTFADKDALNAALAAAPPVVADIANFTNVEPQMMVGEVIA
ncbi:EthD family reductase [Marinovum sp. 2_MG-2023]|uniref:EthD family reductase n=1 Tax=Roseobacteraceae TaxID=2854170 RepID=UPI001FD60C96|nr:MULTISPECIES: EthD family reductase [Roseobacteraceae]MCJ7871793.1 EthD family reductase [Phaeobacter sp. J2-8]MDO6728633.1 EthD family reductase [Marinovum sp. 2_MG-2023]MDO6777951.1 EthD family reductase [Marinovum sp. 1_MG-2023]